MYSFSFCSFCICFFVLYSLKSHVQPTFLFIKLINLFTSNPTRPSILFITIIFFFLKYAVLGLFNKGFCFYVSAEFLHRVLTYMLIHTAILIVYDTFGPKMQIIHKLTDSFFVKIMVTSALNSFDISAMNMISAGSLIGKNAGVLAYFFWMILFGCGGLVNRFLTVYPQEQWSNVKLFRSEVNVYMVTYLVVSFSNIYFEPLGSINQFITFTAVFWMSAHNWRRAEKKKVIILKEKEEKEKEAWVLIRKIRKMSNCSEAETITPSVSVSMVDSNSSISSSNYCWEEYSQICNENNKDIGPQ